MKVEQTIALGSFAFPMTALLCSGIFGEYRLLFLSDRWSTEKRPIESQDQLSERPNFEPRPRGYVDIHVETDQTETVLAIRLQAAVIHNRYCVKLLVLMDWVPSKPIES
jgi:hypothetical protein